MKKYIVCYLKLKLVEVTSTVIDIRAGMTTNQIACKSILSKRFRGSSFYNNQKRGNRVKN